MILQRLGLSFGRPTIVRIHKVSGGNPLYALELARAMSRAANGEMALPGSLSGLVRSRIGGLAMDVQNALLAAACVATPTVELVAGATGTDVEEAARLLADAEIEGIVEIDGGRMRFAHPLLSHGVYTGAAPAGRRAMHRRLAEIVEEPELKARHLALAAVSGDPRTLQTLDAAADMAGVRGAPTAAAELLDLAIRLGGDTPQRRIRLASHYLAAGDLGRARKCCRRPLSPFRRARCAGRP
jgi:hypothetical protein